MNLLTYLYRQSRRLLTIATVAGSIGGVAGAALVAVISKGVSGKESPSALAWSFFGLCLVTLVCKSISEIALLRLTQDAIFRLRVALSRKLLATPLTRLQELGKHGLLAILTKDIDTFIQAFQFLPLAFGNVVVIVACLGYMAWLSWQVFLVFAVCLVVCVTVYHYAERGPLRQLVRMREHMDALYGHFRSLVEGSKELQLNRTRAEQFVGRVLAGSAGGFRDTFVRAMSTYTWVANAGAMMFYLVIGMLLFVLPQWLPQQSATLTAITLTLLYLIKPVTEMVGALPPVRQAAVALNKIMQLNGELDARPAVALATNPFGAQGGLQLELHGVCHRYPGLQDDSHFMLGPLDLSVTQGETVFIVGGNGSGKTTLAMLLLGLYQPEAGTVRLNGVAVTEGNLEHYRSHFSAVFADFHLFDQLLDCDGTDMPARAMRYIEQLQMGHKVRVENGKFTTVNLSTGQRKRLALVASYLEDRPIYLFDEWAADQDPAFKRVFYTELLPDLKERGKTVLVISHDDAYFDCADRIIKLADGHLSEISTPQRTSLHAV
ncbi:putative ATP-binding cassette transporter [Duganella sacchari]|uniref:Putative ATP-binding cassette transporter n=1 Tax=Duganella sacchari TaxID=551987 RepID=A0A1M7LL22_9BURK|nr:cyclic peptide export ABC transporter [Duganella sacchari]SHM78789.1 putative ATP-binding cassette transporter [Duganella sacchari]